ncbi:MAG: 7TM diverse intracellular signaling domain-containing protein [Oligoflexus sp.]
MAKYLLIVTLFISFTAEFAKSDTESLSFLNSWEIAREDQYWQDSTELHSFPAQLTWQYLESKKAPDGINQTIWLRNRLPDDLPEGWGIYIANGMEDVAVFVNSKKIYQYGNFHRDWNQVSSQQWHYIPLDPTWSGQEVHVRYHYALAALTKTLLPTIEKPIKVYQNTIRNNLLLLIMVGGFSTMAIIACLLAISRRKLDLFAHFAFISFSAAIWVLFNQDAGFKQYYGALPKYWAAIDVFALFTGVAAFYRFNFEICRSRHLISKLAMLGPWMVLACAVLGHLFGVLHPWYLIPFLHVTAFFAIVVLLGQAVFQSFRQAGEARIFTLGCFAVWIAGVHDILRYIEGFPSLGWAMIPFGVMGLFVSMGWILAARFAEERQEAIRIREQMIEKVEALVEEKTRDIRSIMTHIKIGIFALTKGQFKIHKDHSDYLLELFEKDHITDENGFDLLFANSNMTSDEKSQIHSALTVALGEESFVFHTNSHCLPLEIRHSRRDGSQRILELDWNPICNAQDIIEKILVTVRDVTLLRELADEAKDKAEELNFIGELINVPAEAFRRFIQDCYDFVNENRKLIHSRSPESKDMEVLKVLFINMHTMKGAARSLYFKKMTKIFHEVEQYYALLQGDPEVCWDIKRMLHDLDEVEVIIRTYESISRDKLGRKSDEEKIIEISESEATQIYQFLNNSEISKANSEQNYHKLQDSLFTKIYRSAESIFEEITDCLPALAKDLQKAKPQLKLQTQDLYLNSIGETLLRKIFVHILRNSLDHGIESPEVRLNLGKAEAGLIRIEMEDLPSEEFIVLRYLDDGSGLNLAKIREIALKKRWLPEEDLWDFLAVAQLIFHSGLSTVNQVSEISGRGVGMEAVRNYLLRVGGAIDIELLETDMKYMHGCPFAFVIRLPKHLFAKATHKSWDDAA